MRFLKLCKGRSEVKSLWPKVHGVDFFQVALRQTLPAVSFRLVCGGCKLWHERAAKARRCRGVLRVSGGGQRASWRSVFYASPACVWMLYLSLREGFALGVARGGEARER